MTSKNAVTKRKQSLTRSRVGDSWFKPRVNLGNALDGETQLTSNHLAAASNASTASLTAPRILSTSNQHKNFFSRNRWRTGIISGAWTVCLSTRCLCHDLHAYRK